MPENYKISLGGFPGGSSYSVTIEGCDDIALTELKCRVNRAIMEIISDGTKRFNGEPVKKKDCGCGGN